jgi:hypothetical protein
VAGRPGRAHDSGIEQENDMTAGTKIIVTWPRPEGDMQESATIAKTTKMMRPLPAGYVPVRFKTGTVLVHSQYIRHA